MSFQKINQYNLINYDVNLLEETKKAGLNNLICPIKMGEYIVIGSRPGMGKTSFLLYLMVDYLFNKKHPVAFLSLEANFSMIFPKLKDIAIKKGIINQESNNIDLPLFVSDNKTYESIDDFEKELVSLITNKGVKVILIDTIQHFRVKNVVSSINILSSIIHKLSREYNTTFITTSQLSKEVEIRGGDKKPYLISDIRDSGNIGNDADKIMYLYRHEVYGIFYDEEGEDTKGILNINLIKNRNGNTGEINIGIEELCSSVPIIEDEYLNIEEPNYDDELVDFNTEAIDDIIENNHSYYENKDSSDYWIDEINTPD